mgnify:CR=1 FL=1
MCLTAYEKNCVPCYENSRIMANSNHIRLTESELDILMILWQKGEASVREVHQVLSKTKDSGYTTTLKLMQIMFEKGLVKRDEKNKAHLYKPTVNRQKIQKQYLNKMIKGLFAGSSGELILQALMIKKPTLDEAEAIKKQLVNVKK